MECWQDDLREIRDAVNAGIIVVEVAGNGGLKLDDLNLVDLLGDIASRPNPLNPKNTSSGAILVGAGAPPSNRHGPDRSRLEFSNYGARVDAQGWGEELFTAGWDNHFNPLGDLDRAYSPNFRGTSSAAAIVAGALACVQGILMARGFPVLSPRQARRLLQITGSPQQDAPGRPAATQQIGSRPNLREMITLVLDPVMVRTRLGTD